MLYNSGDFTAPIVTSRAGYAAVQLPVPITINLLGLQFYDQFLTSDPSANRLGLTTTQGGAGIVGSR